MTDDEAAAAAKLAVDVDVFRAFVVVVVVVVIVVVVVVALRSFVGNELLLVDSITEVIKAPIIIPKSLAK